MLTAVGMFGNCLKEYVRTGAISISDLQKSIQHIPTTERIKILRGNSEILQTASCEGHNDVIRILLIDLAPEMRFSLLKAGSPPPLFSAAYWNQNETVNALLSCLSSHKQKFDLLCATHESQTAVGVATMRNHQTTADTLRRSQIHAGK